MQTLSKYQKERSLALKSRTTEQLLKSFEIQQRNSRCLEQARRIELKKSSRFITNKILKH